MSRSKALHKSSLVMIMPGEFSNELKIPSAHVNHFNEISSKILCLKISMRMWEVHLKRSESELSFGKGWRDFVEDNSIESSDLLYFKINGSPRIKVTIYCRKERTAGSSVKTCLDKKQMQHESNMENVELSDSGRMYRVVDDEDDGDVHFYRPRAATRQELDNVCDKSGREEDISFETLKSNNCSGDASNKGDKDFLQPVAENMEVVVGKQLIINKGVEVYPSTLAESSEVEVKSNLANRRCQLTKSRFGRSSKNGRSNKTCTTEPNGHGQLCKIDGSRDGDIDEDIFPLSYIMGKHGGRAGHDHSAKADELRAEDTYEQDVPVYRKRKTYAGKTCNKKSPVKKKAAGIDKPKKFLTPFFVFMEEFRQIYKKVHPANKYVTVVGRAGGEKWKNMSEEEKAPYVADAWARRNLPPYQTKQAEERIVEDKEEAEPKSEVNNEIDDELSYIESDSNEDEELRNDDGDDDAVNQEEDCGRDDEEMSNEEDDKEDDVEVEGEVDQVEETDFSDNN